MVFVVCQSFTIVADIYEVVTCSYEEIKSSLCSSTDHIENIIDIAHFMLSFNASVNFLLYAIHDKMFRDAFVKVSMLSKHKRWDMHIIYKTPHFLLVYVIFLRYRHLILADVSLK